MAYRLDVTGTASRIERTPQGGLRVPGFLTRTGVLTYLVNGKSIREYRPPEEVFHADSLASLANAPVTLRHPMKEGRGVKVDPANFREFAVGYLAGPPSREDSMVAGEVIIQDAEAVKAVSSATHRELSCGYDCRTDETPGTTPEGEPYDRIQRDIRYNHVAIVPRGRAGSSVRLRLDSEDNQIHEDETENGEKRIMTPEQIQAMMNENATLRARADAAEKATTAEKARADAAEGERDALKARADAAEKAAKEATDPARIDAAVEARSSIIERARPHLPKDFAVQGKTNRDVQVAALVGRDKDFKADGKDDVYVSAFFDAVMTSPAANAGGSRSDAADLQRAASGARQGAGDGKGSESREDADDPYAARARMEKANREAGSSKLAFSKD